MYGSRFDKQTQRECTCSLVHGTWRCVGAKIACAGACALMVGQLLLLSVALATECADPAAGTDEVAAAPVTPTVAEDTAAPSPVPVAPAAPMTDAAPAAPSTAEAQQDQQDAPAATVNDAGAADQDGSLGGAESSSANDAIMPCGVTDVTGGSGVKVNTTVSATIRTASFRTTSRSKRASRIPMISPMLRAACRMSRSANLSKPSTTGPMLLRAPWLKSRTHLCPM